jgi:hypothetical protein
MFRHWRIQVSLICFALLLGDIVLWVHSYKWVDSYWHRREDVIEFAFISYKGAICFAVFSPIGIPSADGFRSERIDLNVMEKGLGGNRPAKSLLGFSEYKYPRSWGLGVPYWFISIIFAILCGSPWYLRRFNFSLRTFFIAITVLAVAIGFIGWLIR